MIDQSVPLPAPPLPGGNPAMPDFMPMSGGYASYNNTDQTPVISPTFSTQSIAPPVGSTPILPQESSPTQTTNTAWPPPAVELAVTAGELVSAQPARVTTPPPPDPRGPEQIEPMPQPGTGFEAVNNGTAIPETPVTETIPNQSTSEPVVAAAPSPPRAIPPEPLGYTQMATPPGTSPTTSSNLSPVAFPAVGTATLPFSPMPEAPALTIDNPPPPAETGKSKLAAIIGIIVAGLFLLAVSATVVLAAYELVPIPQKYQQAAAAIIFKLPFMPKTPEQVLLASAKAHQQAKSAEIDLSMAMSSQNAAQFLGTGNLDFALKGAVDGADPKKPQFSLNFQLTNQFDLDLTLKDQILFFRINKLPELLLGTMMGITDPALAEDLMRVWVRYDMTQLETKAREMLDGEQESLKEPQTELSEADFTELYQEVIRPHLKMTSNDSQYQMVIDLPAEAIDRLVAKLTEDVTAGQPPVMDSQTLKPSDLIKKLKLELWINRDDYYVNKASLFTRVDNQAYLNNQIKGGLGSTMERETVDLAVNLSLAKVGETMEIYPPAESLTLEEYMTKLGQYFVPPAGLYEPTSPQSYNRDLTITSSRDTQRKADLYSITNAIYQYGIENNGELPPTLTATPTDAGRYGLALENYLVPTYLAAMPVDPSYHPASVVTGYVFSIKADGRVVGTAISEVNPGELITVER